MTVVTRSEEETGDVAARIAATLVAGDVLLLSGNLGAGKTAFVRGLAAGLGAVLGGGDGRPLLLCAAG